MFHDKILSYGFKLVPDKYMKVYHKKHFKDDKDVLELTISHGSYSLHFTEIINGQVEEFILAHRYEIKEESQLDFLLRNNLRCKNYFKSP